MCFCSHCGTLVECEKNKLKRKVKTKTDPRIIPTIIYFSEIYKKNSGATYIPCFGRDAKLIKNIFNGLAETDQSPESHIRSLIDRFLHKDNPFKGNNDIPSFCKAFNRLQTEANKKSWKDTL